MAKKKIIFLMVLLFTICFISTNMNTKVFAETGETSETGGTDEAVGTSEIGETAETDGNEVITKGVYIDSIHVGGMTADEAKNAVEGYIDNLKLKNITVNVDDKNESITLDKLGFSYEDNDYINQALNIGKTGNLIKRYKELKDTENTNLVYNLQFKLDDDKVKKFVKKKCSAYDVKAKNASVKRENGEFIYTEDKIGRKINVDETTEAIKTAILENWNQEDINLAAVVDEDKPEYTTEMVKECSDLLGTYSTTYETSSENRAGNLANGAKLVNNTVLYPDDVFSAYDKLTPFTTENGYYEAGAYSNGKVIDSIGGGACQVTTTLYNALLFSELEITERYNHSMSITYVDLSRDAAIAGTWKDLKFKNNTQSPILIEATTSGRTITFKIWGKETRDTKHREIKFETVVLDQMNPGKDEVTEDPTKPVTYELTTQSAHIGYVAELYKLVYEDGVEVSRTRVNKSVYNPSPRYVTIGTKKEEKPVENTKEEDTSEEGTKTGGKNNQDTTEGDSKPAMQQDNNSKNPSTDEENSTEEGNSLETDQDG